MIEWRIVLSALAGGLALTCWLESRHRLMQSQVFTARLLQGTAVFTSLLSVGLFLVANRHPVWQQSTPLNIDVETAVVTSPTSIPPTLAPPSVFILATPAQPPANKPTNTTTQHAFLHIPELDISQPIVNLPLENGRWDVSQLGERIGHLTSTGNHPGGTLAPVFAGHMTFPTSTTLETGAFANLQYATYETEVHYETNGNLFVYKVTEISRVAPSEVEKLYLE
ncbi:MAG: sortase, partial [Chloroflexi bacterium]